MLPQTAKTADKVFKLSEQIWKIVRLQNSLNTKVLLRYSGDTHLVNYPIVFEIIDCDEINKE